jgi:ATP:corrinoid adenosyltransferase
VPRCRLLNKALVVRAQHDIDEALAVVKELREHLVVLDELLIGARLAALRGAANSLNTTVRYAHFVGVH